MFLQPKNNDGALLIHACNSSNCIKISVNDFTKNNPDTDLSFSLEETKELITVLTSMVAIKEKDELRGQE